MYDLAGRRTEEIDPLNRTTVFDYDGAGNRTLILDASGNRTTLTYDPNDRLVQKEAGAQVTTYAYDHLCPGQPDPVRISGKKMPLEVHSLTVVGALRVVSVGVRRHVRSPAGP